MKFPNASNFFLQLCLCKQFFFQENVAANNFLAHFIAGSVTLLLPLTKYQTSVALFFCTYPLRFSAAFSSLL